MKIKLTKRGEHYHIRKRVPRRFKSIEDREYIWLSLHTDSASLAEQKAKTIWTEMLEAWESKLVGDEADALGRMEAAKNLAAKRGFRWAQAKDVAKMPLKDILDRVDAVATRRGGKPDTLDAEAVLGGAQPPKLTVSRALDAFWKDASLKIKGKTDNQIRVWKNPRIKAINNFIDVVGDLPIDEITTRDLRAFKRWWMGRIEEEDLTPNSANKDIGYVLNILGEVAASEDIELQYKTEKLRIPEDEKGLRPPFSDGWISERILKPGALDGMNDEARDILLAMINTGARLSEIQNIDGSEIVLDHDIPHINLTGKLRPLKTRNAKRKLPLFGVSLEAMKRHPDGFPRYFDKAGLSATLNKYLRENGLLETEKHSAYSMRHAFEDRMLRAGIDERIRADLMGHALKRERYGEGGGLEYVAGLVKPISFM